MTEKSVKRGARTKSTVINKRGVDPAAKEKSLVTKDEWREYTKTVWSIANTSHDDHPAVFPEEIPYRLAKLFSFYGETVLDPFAGTGTTARAVIPLGRRAVCVDQNADYVHTIKKECGKLQNGHGPTYEPLVARRGDSRNLSFVKDDSVGLVVTSPPYWNKADYGISKNNLGQIENYSSFLEAVRPVFQECFRALIPGRKLCVVTANVNQHTDHGLLTFPLATDFGVLLRDIGFVMVNEIIWSKDGTGGKWGSYGAQTPDIRELSLSTKLFVQERARVHFDFCQARIDENDWTYGETLQRPHGWHGTADRRQRLMPLRGADVVP